MSIKRVATFILLVCALGALPCFAEDSRSAKEEADGYYREAQQYDHDYDMEMIDVRDHQSQADQYRRLAQMDRSDKKLDAAAQKEGFAADEYSKYKDALDRANGYKRKADEARRKYQEKMNDYNALLAQERSEAERRAAAASASRSAVGGANAPAAPAAIVAPAPDFSAPGMDAEQAVVAPAAESPADYDAQTVLDFASADGRPMPLYLGPGAGAKLYALTSERRILDGGMLEVWIGNDPVLKGSFTVRATGGTQHWKIRGPRVGSLVLGIVSDIVAAVGYGMVFDYISSSSDSELTWGAVAATAGTVGAVWFHMDALPQAYLESTDR